MPRRAILACCLIILTLFRTAATSPVQADSNDLCPAGTKGTGTAAQARGHACALYAQGMNALYYHDPAAADRAFTAALAADPRLTSALYARVVARYELTRYRSAQADLLDVFDRIPALRAQYYNTRAALLDAQHAPANRAYDEYIGALVGIVIGDKAGAFRLLNAAIARDARLAEAYHFRGNIYDDMGDRQHAEADYRQALALAPRSFGTLYAYGLLMDEEGRYAEERDTMSRAIAIRPTEVEAWVDRGIARDRLGDVVGGIADETHALRLDPSSTDAWIDRSDFDIDAHQYRQAIADATSALRFGPIPAAYLARANARRAVGDAHGSYADASAAIRLDPHYENAFVARGNASGDLGHWSSALADARRAIALVPSDAYAYNLAGWTLINLNRLTEAEHYLNQALSINPVFVDALVNRCEARSILRDFAGSQDDCTRAIARDPGDAAAYLDRGIDRYYLGNITAARADLTHALAMFTAGHNARGTRLATMWLDRLR